MEKTTRMAGRQRVTMIEARRGKRKGHSRIAMADMNKPPARILVTIGGVPLQAVTVSVTLPCDSCRMNRKKDESRAN